GESLMSSVIADDIVRQGHHVLKHVYDSKILAKLRDEVVAALASFGWLDKSRPNTATRPLKQRQEGSAGWWQCYAGLQRIEGIHRLAFEQDVVDAVREALGGAVFSHGRRPISIVFPGHWIPPHQDFVTVQGTPDTLTAWIPLLANVNGEFVLRIADQSLRPIVAPLSHMREGGVGIRTEAAKIELRPVGVELGDAILLHGMTIYEVMANNSSIINFACMHRFQRDDHLVCEASLYPHHYPRVPDWPVLSKGWEREWISFPDRLNISKFKLPRHIEQWHEVLEVPHSLMINGHGFKSD
ncbi:hypothetical protein, partial [Rubinisphaera margarita]|uniref:hypothetical protein n=1 Tax=Rubinisphaera margarita TaxID=2909586 RepID=UPI001EE8B492